MVRRMFGGLAGILTGMNGFRGDMESSYNRGEIKGTDSVGGLIGCWGIGLKAEYCYSDAIVTGNSNIGGMIGFIRDGITKDCINNCYCLGSETSVACGNKADWDSDFEIAKDNLTSDYSHLLGDEFDMSVDGYPILKWETKKQTENK